MEIKVCMFNLWLKFCFLKKLYEFVTKSVAEFVQMRQKSLLKVFNALQHLKFEK